MAEQQDSSADGVREAEKGLPYKWLALIAVAIGTYMGTMDASIVNISFPTLSKTFGVDASVVLWVSVAYLLASTGLMLTLGRLGDLIGRKKVYILGFVIFTLGMGLCSLAQNIGQLIGFRVVQAIGSAMLIAVGNAIVIDAFPGRERGKALGIMGGVVSAGFITGPLIGGVLLDAFDWRSIFYIRLPVGVIGIIMAWLILRGESRARTRVSFDLRGAVTLFGGLTTLLLLVNQGGKVGWTSPYILILGAATVTLLALFVVAERKAIQPVVDLALFRSRLFAAANASLLLIFVATAAYSFLMPFYLIQGLGYSSSRAGLLMITVALTTIVVAPLSGWLSDKIGSRILCSLGMAVVCLALFLLSGLSIHSTTTEVIPWLIIFGLGSGLFQAPNSSAIMGSVPRDKLGTGAAMIATGRQVGMSIGIAVAGAIFTSRQAFHMARLAHEQLSPAALRSEALVAGFQDALLVSVLICSIGIITSLVRGRYHPMG